MTTTLSSIITGGKDSGIGGSGKRAAYAMLSHNTSSAWYGYCLYDESFNWPLNYGYPGNLNTYGPSSVVQLESNTYTSGNNIFFDGNVSASQTQANTSGTNNYTNATNASGEFGNAGIDIFSDGTFGRCSRGGDYTQKHYLNAYAINSDHSDKRNVYLFTSGVIRCVDRLWGNYSYDKAGTAAYTVSSSNTSMQGSASYNVARKELTILSYAATNGAYNVITFQNVDFDAYPSPAIALARPEVVRVNSTLTIPNWNVNNNESFYNLKPVVSADGSVFVVVFFTSNDQALFKFTRNGVSAVTATRLATASCTTSYGFDQSYAYGQRQITSKDGNAVCVFCPYYYYGAGIRAFIIDKLNNTYTSYGNASTNAGVMTIPFRENGFAFYSCGNVYASNWNGASVNAMFERTTTAMTFAQTGSTRYLSQFTGPNTTNYPGFTQVTDYVLLPSTAYGVK